jgi:Ca-activated chloride channel homolog
MSKVRIPRALLFSLLVLVPCMAPRAQEPPTTSGEPIRLNVNVVTIGTVVTDDGGQFVEGLTREDFHVFDNGVEQPLVFFALDRPTHVLLLIEAGPAVYLLQGGHLRAAYALLGGLAPADQVAVAKYAEAAEGVSDFSPDKQLAANALDHVNFNVGFGALNLSESLTTVLDWLEKTPDKKTIVLLSSGVDTSSPAATTALLQRLRVSDIRLLAVSLSGELRSRPSEKGKKKGAAAAPSFAEEQFAAADYELRALAAATGGRAYFPTDEKGFSSAYTEIAQMVRHEYTLGFSPLSLDGQVHGVEVRVTGEPGDARSVSTGPNAKARVLRIDHRQAYVARLDTPPPHGPAPRQ